MKEYYKPVDFGVEIETPKTEAVETVLDIKEQLKAITGELSLIGQGQSDLMPIAVHFGAKIHPHQRALKTMQEAPTKDNIRNFIFLVKEDLSRRVAQEFAKLFKEIDPELEGLL